MKMYEIIELNNLYALLKDKKLPIKTAYKFNKLARLIEKEIAFYQENFEKIILEFGQYNEQGQLILSEDRASIAVIKGKEKECADRIAELREIEVDLNGIEFTIDELADLEISISELSCLMPLIKE